VVAYLALFAALGGGAYAASKVGSGDIKRNAVLSKHIKGGNVKPPDLDPGILRPIAYGQVHFDGTVSTGQGIDNSNVEKPTTGVYCFAGIEGASFRRAVATPVYFAGDKTRTTSINSGDFDVSGDCDPGTQLSVVVQKDVDGGTAALVDTGFIILLF
jgi:hypothetical protein